MDLSELTAEKMQPHVGTTFIIHVEDGRKLEFTLRTVAVLMEKHISPRLKRDTFGLYFTGPDKLYLPQGIYPMYHETLGGPLQLFLVPIAQDDGRYEYEAVFN